MQRGYRSSEFWIAALWSGKAALAVAALLASRDWPTALIALPAVCVLVWMAGVVSNNYGENRFNLKAQRFAAGLRPEQEADGPPQPFGFGRHVAQPNGEDEGD